jgi:hypothetical protein
MRIWIEPHVRGTSEPPVHFQKRSDFKDAHDINPSDCKPSMLQVRVMAFNGDTDQGIVRIPDSDAMGAARDERNEGCAGSANDGTASAAHGDLPPNLHNSMTRRLTFKRTLLAQSEHMFAEQAAMLFERECGTRSMFYGQENGNRYELKIKQVPAYTPSKVAAMVDNAARAKVNAPTGWGSALLRGSSLEAVQTSTTPPAKRRLALLNGPHDSGGEDARACSGTPGHAPHTPGSASVPTTSAPLNAEGLGGVGDMDVDDGADDPLDDDGVFDESSSRVKPPPYWIRKLTDQFAFNASSVTNDLNYARNCVTRNLQTNGLEASVPCWSHMQFKFIGVSSDQNRPTHQYSCIFLVIRFVLASVGT